MPQKSKYASKPALTIHCHYHKTVYSKLPRSSFDCFHGFTVFSNRFVEKDSRICYDVGPRTLRTIIEPDRNTISSYVATPPDIEKDLLLDLIFFQPLKFILQEKKLYILHASCAVRNGQGVIFSGKSGSGKSSLALALLRHGFSYLADDKLVIRSEVGRIQCCVFSSRPKISKRSLALFPEFKDFVINGGARNEKILIDVDRISPPQKTAEPAMLIFPKFTRSALTRLEPLDKQSALARLAREESSHLKNVGRKYFEAHFMMLSDFIRHVKCYKLFYSDRDFKKVPELIIPLLQKKS